MQKMNKQNYTVRCLYMQRKIHVRVHELYPHKYIMNQLLIREIVFLDLKLDALAIGC